MAYEVFKRTGVRVDTPTLSIVPDGRISINAAACRILSQARIKSVVLLWDKANHKIALRAASGSDKNAYAVSITDRHSGSIRAKAFVEHIGWKSGSREAISAAWDEKEKMFEAVVPARFLGQPTPPSEQISRRLPGKDQR